MGRGHRDTMTQDHTWVNLIFCIFAYSTLLQKLGCGGQHVPKGSLRITNELWILCALEGRLLQCTNKSGLPGFNSRKVSRPSAHRVKAFCLCLEHGFLGLTRPGPELLHMLGLPLLDPGHSDQGPGKSLCLTVGSPPTPCPISGYSSGSSESSCCVSCSESFLGNITDEHQTYPWSLGLNSTHSGDMLGIQNPIVCLQANDTLAFLVTREHYPEYDL